MTQVDLLLLWNEAGGKYSNDPQLYDILTIRDTDLERFAALILTAERSALEAAVLQLRRGVGAHHQYIQGRWDAIGEVQDLIRARSKT